MHMMKWAGEKGLACLLLVFAVGAYSLPAGAQNLDEVLTKTYETNPSLAAARSGMYAAVEQLPQAQAGYLPKISVQGTEGRSRVKQRTKDTNALGSEIQGVNKTLIDRSLELDLSLNLYQGGQTMAATSAAEANVAKSLAQFHTTEQKVLLDATTSYAAIGLYQSLARMANERNRELERLRAWANDMYAHQQITITSVADVDTQIASANTNNTSIQSQLRTAKSRYLAVTGLMPESIEQWPGLPSLPASRDEAASLAMKNNPSIQQAAYALQASEQEINRLDGTLLPSVDAYSLIKRDWNKSRFTGINDYTEHAREDTWSVGLNVTMPIFEGGLQYAQIREAKQLYVQSQHQLIDATRSVLAQVEEQWDALQTAKAQRINGEAMKKAASIALNGYKRQLKNGTSTIQDVLDSHGKFIDALTAIEQADHDVFIAKANLLAAIGVFGAQQLNLPVSQFDSESLISSARFRWIGTGIE